MKPVFRKLFLGSFIVVAGIFLMQARIEWPQSANSADKKYWTETSTRRSNGNAVDIDKLNKVFTELNDTLSPSVVNIYTTSKIAAPRMSRYGRGSQEDLFDFFFGNPFGGGPSPYSAPRQQEATALGSGFVIHESGLIITNSHVVRPTGKNADSIRVKFLSDKAQSEGHPAEVLGVDETTDVAVIKLKNRLPSLKVAPLGNSDQVKVGEWVMAIGNPYGHQHSVTKGIVSALGRNISDNLPTFQRADFIQTDASINPGNSGGPLFNLYGEVIGINTAIDARAQGIGFAIPINIAKSVVSQIIEKGAVTLGWIGVTIHPITPQIAESLGLKEPQGVLIQDTIPGEPAEKAGFKSYDVIVEANGNVIKTERDFQRLIASSPVGTNISFKVIREGKTINLSAKVGKRPTEQELAERSQDEPPRGSTSVEKIGIELADLTPGLRSRIRLPAGVSGALIALVAEGSAAEATGLRVGDVITEVDRRPVRGAGDAAKALSAKKNRFLLKVQRGTASLIVFLDLN